MESASQPARDWRCTRTTIRSACSTHCRGDFNGHIATMNCIDNCAPCCAKPPRGDCPFDANKPRLTVLFTPFSADHHPKLLCRSISLLPLLAESHRPTRICYYTYVLTYLGLHVQVLIPPSGLIGSRRRRISGQSITQPTNLYNSLYFYRYHTIFFGTR